jgi:hypothetical protein
MVLEAPSARAEIVRFRFSGIVNVHDAFDNIAPDDLVSGLPFTGTLAYHTTLADALPEDPQRGRYSDASAVTDRGFVVHIGSYVFRTDPADEFSFFVGNDVHLGVSETGEPQPPIGDVIQGTNVAIFPFYCVAPSIGFRWQDLTGAAFDNDRPRASFDVALLQTNQADAPIIDIDCYLSGTVQSGPRGILSIEASIDRIERVPEPGTCFLALSLFTAFALVARLRRKV